MIDVNETYKNYENSHISPILLSVNSDGQMFHWHEEYVEIMFVIAGSVEVQSINKEYLLKEDDIIIFNRKIPHRIKKINEKYMFLSLFIDTSYYEKYIPNISRVFFVNNLSVHSDDDETVLNNLKNNVAQIYIELRDRKEDYEKRIINNGISILTILINGFNYIKKSPDSYRNIEKFERFWMICRYMLNNHTKKISLSEMAKYVHVSESHLSHSIKEATGMNFEELLNLYRSEDAARLLLATNMSITKVSYECGFSDQKYLNSFFKKFFGCSPADYRTKNQPDYSRKTYEEAEKSAIYDEELLISKMNSYILGKNKLQNAAQPPEFNLRINAEEMTYPFKHYWKEYIDIGEASNLFKSSYQNIIKDIQNDIGFKYIKFHNLFNSEMVQINSGDVNIDWNSLYNLFDFIYEAGSRPFITIGFEKYLPGIFKTIATQFINNCIERYGLEEVGNWRLSVVNPFSNESVYKKYLGYLNILNSLLSKAFPDRRADIGVCEIQDSRHLLYDTVFMGPFFINKVIRGINGDKDISQYSIIFDKYNTELFHGGRGLATTKGLKKPLYYAYCLLSMLGDRIISQGPNYLITKLGEDIQVLLYNTPPSIDEESINGIQTEASNRYSVFILEEDIKVNLRVSNLKGNTYLVKKYLLNRKYGSIFDHFSDGRSPAYISSRETEYLNRICCPRLSFDLIKGQKYINISSKLEPNSAELYILKKV